MKTFILLMFGVTVASAQTPSLDANATATNSSSQTIIGYQQGIQAANQNVWQKIVQITDAQGNVTYQTNNAYKELATGLNHLVNGKWVASKEEIDISADGNSALATNGQHQAYFPGDIYSGQIKLVTPDGKQLFSRPVGLSYFDGTNSVLIAELTNSTGEVVGNNQVIYANAFTDFKADLRYTYTKAGFEQDIILREQPPGPASFGLNPNTTTLQVLTEFFNPPQPTMTATTVSTAAGNLEDDNLNFGVMQMIPGKAFLLGTNSPSVAVNKQWLMLDDRQLLVEEVPVVSIAAELENLALSQATSIQTNPPLNVVSTKRLLPAQRLATVPGKHPVQLAQATPSSDGLVLDYNTVNGSLTNYTFQGDTTYYISGTVYLYGTNTFEGGTVIKYANTNSATMSTYGPVNCLTGPYRPAIFTAKDDNTVGETISGSTGNPTNSIQSSLLSVVDYSGDLEYMRFAYANQGLTAVHGEIKAKDCQFINDAGPIIAIEGSLDLENVLICNVSGSVFYGYDGSYTAQNITVHNANTLCNGGDLYITNSLLIACTNLGTGFDGACNYTNSSDAGIFQAVGAGSHYLATNSIYRNAGITNIDPALLADLRTKTTYPPLLLTNQTISANTNFNPQALRDTNSSPDLGYHYDPLDYFWNNLSLTNATMTLTNGVAIGVYGTTGLGLQGGAALISQGTPLIPNQLVSYHSVQEQSILLGATNTGCTYLNPTATNSVIRLRFTDVSSVAMPHDTTYVIGGTGLNSFNLVDCQVSAMLIYIFDPLVVSPGYVGMTNNIFWRCHLDFGNIFNSYSLTFYNNLCFGGESDFYGGSSWYVGNNLFDTITTAANSGVVNDHNGYHDAATLSVGGSAGDVEVSDPVEYETGPLGNYYYPTDDYNLSYLLNAGSTNANTLGLYHYTVTTNEVVDGTNTVSIGYHYVATDSNGNPLDSNGDGIPDYLEDANGDGIVNNGETNWSLAIVTQPQSQSAYVGDTVTFSVGVQGALQWIYQWQFNGTNISGATNSTFNIGVVQTNNSGGYCVAISDSAGSITSATATLSVSIPAYAVLFSSQTNYIFRGDTTYYISGTVNLYGTNTFEGGAVIKYAPNASINVSYPSLVQTPAAAYRPVIFTAKDDNTVGNAISGSTGNPTNYYANPALYFGGVYYQPQTFSNLRFAYAQQALSVDYLLSAAFYNIQIVNCANGVYLSDSTTVNFFNTLFVNTGICFDNCDDSILNVENGTFNNINYLATSFGYDFFLNIKNSVLANMTVPLINLPYTLTGNSNGFYNASEFGNGATTNIFYPFQTVGAGSCYLTNGCAFLNVGTTNIDPTLLASLAQKTTYPPFFLTNQTLSVNTNFSPQALRDTNSSPSLGYHYDPIDYIADLYTVTNATLTLTNGVAIASYNEAGVQLQRGSKIVSTGSPLYPNWFVRYSSVQEQSVSLHGTNSGGIDVKPTYTSVMPNAQYQFTKFACPAGGGIHLYDYNTSSLSNLTVQECEFWGGTNVLGGTNSAVMTLNNNLFARSVISAVGSGALSFTNNLVWGASLAQLNPSGTNVWRAYNNDFDSSTITNSTLTNGYNAYLNYSGYLSPTNTTDIFSTNTLAYQTSWLGTFYQPSTSLLIDMGSTNASALGLYHYTTQINQVPETNSTVDIGYHYVVTDTNGIPLDSNGDGIPDYLEDANGDGIVDNGETNWGLAILIQPVSQTVVQGTNVTFSVTAQGVAPLNYQWYFNGTNLLAGATNNSITISNVQPANVGSYQLVVTNFTGSLTSSAVTLTLTCDGPPSGLVGWWQAESNALDSAGTDNGIVTNGVSYTGGKVGTAFNFDGTNGFIQIPDASDLKPTNLTIEVWVRFSSLNSKRYGTYGGGPPAGEQFIVTKPNIQVNPYQSAYVLYKWRNGSVDNFEFEVDSTNGTQVYVTSSVSIQTNVWYHVAAVRGSNYVQLFVNGQPTSRATVSFAQNYGTEPLFIGSSGQPSYWDAMFEGSLDEVSLYNRALSTNEIVAIYAAGTNGLGKCFLPPTIITQPSNQTAVAGSTVTLTIGAMGSQPLNYQWYFNGTNLNGATSSSLTITNIQSSQAGNYAAVVMNLAGSVTSSNAMLTILTPPSITLQPTNQTVVMGQSAAFVVTANGSGPLSYQWYSNSVALTGASSTNLIFTNASTNYMANYYVVITNAEGSVTSSIVSLTVTAPTSDSDYDGRSDGQEITDGTDPFNPSSVSQVRLAYFPFDDTNAWSGSAGQLPLIATNIVGVPSWSTNAVLIDNTNGAVLTYRDVETNGNANINLRAGTVRFWFNPDWNSTSLLLSNATFAGSNFSFSVTGPTGTAWNVSLSTNLTTWTNIGSMTLNPSGYAAYTDTTASASSYCFYHLSNSNYISQAIGFERIIVWPGTPTNPGTNALLANQLLAPTNTLDGLFNPTMPDGSSLPVGTMIQKWNAVAQAYSSYIWTNSQWIDTNGYPAGNVTLNPGEGAFLLNPTNNLLTVTFAGLVPAGNLSIPLATEQNSMASSMVPQAGGLATALDYAPNVGDTVLIWNGYNYNSYNYTNGGTNYWFPSEPVLNVGQAVFIEPSSNNVWQVNFGQSQSASGGRFIEVGSQSSPDWWTLMLDLNGDFISLVTQTNGMIMNNLAAPINWTSNTWHQIALTYSTNGSALYVDGLLATNGLGTVYWPRLSIRTNGFTIGGSASGMNQARGIFDELETFNYPLDAQSIWTGYTNDENLTIVQGPQSQSVMEGDAATFVVTALGKGLTYQWKYNGAALPGKTSPTLSLSSVTTNNAGSYSVTVANSLQSASASASLAVLHITFPSPYNYFYFTVSGVTAGSKYDIYFKPGPGLNSPANWRLYYLGDWGQSTMQFLLPSVSGGYFEIGPALDTDGDGLRDGYENLVSLTSSTSTDTDGDGMPDGWETLWGTNPNLNDANVIEASDGYNNLYKYKHAMDPWIPYNANPRPAVTITPVNGTFVIARTGSTSSSLTVNFTVGGTAIYGQDYTLSSSASLSAGSTYPFSVTIPAGQSSVTLTPTSIPAAKTVLIGLIPCSLSDFPSGPSTWPYVAISSIGYGDTDGDGLADAMEAAFGCNPFVFDDLNSDGIPDWREDSDQDGLPDSYERMIGLNPTSAEPAPSLPTYSMCPIP
jgi:hypothetical protein